ncbi:MAG TPA: hypothetical protein VMK53_07060 [Gemmatimonadales bacterium]|nr:hypothetical protein [Gemmatimonadales bacterium]
MSLSLAAGMLAAWGLVQGDARRRALLLVAALLLGLAAASVAASLGDSRPESIAGTAWDAGGLVFLQIVAGMALLAMVTALAAAPHPVTLVIVALAGGVSWPLVQLGGIIRPVGFAAVVAAGGAFGWILVVRARPGRFFLALDRGVLDPQDGAAWRPSRDWVPTAWPLVAATAAVVALLIPHLATVLGGSLVAVIAVFTASRQGGRPAWGLLPAIPLLFVILLWSLHLSGPLGGWIPNLINGPFSPRAAQLLAAMTAGALVPLAGLWPLHGVSVPILAAPLVVAVGAVFAALLIPDGIQWWQPILAPLAVLAMAHALARRLPAQFLMAAGVFGLWTGTRAGALGGAVLVMSAWALVMVPVSWAARLPVTPVAARLLWLPTVAGAIALLHGAITTEVTYTLAAVILGAAAIIILSDEDASLVDPHR